MYVFGETARGLLNEDPMTGSTNCPNTYNVHKRDESFRGK
jgi:hypothetical protein